MNICYFEKIAKVSWMGKHGNVEKKARECKVGVVE